MAHTMREVARRAGVSLATVSRVLNNTQYISEETRRRVLDAVREFNYFKNVHARRLATGRSDLFGLVISEIANPYFPEIIRGYQAMAWNRGFDVLLCNTEYDPERTKAVMRKLRESDVRGVAIVTSSVDRSMASELTAAGIPVVLCNSDPAATPCFTRLPQFPDEMEAIQLPRSAFERFAENAKAEGIQFLGGCCGCNAAYIHALARGLAASTEAAQRNVG